MMSPRYYGDGNPLPTQCAASSAQAAISPIIKLVDHLPSCVGYMCKMNGKHSRPLLATASFKSASGMLHGRENVLTFSIHLVAVHHRQHSAIRRIQNTSQPSGPLYQSRLQGSVLLHIVPSFQALHAFYPHSSALVASCCCPCRHCCHQFLGAVSRECQHQFVCSNTYRCLPRPVKPASQGCKVLWGTHSCTHVYNIHVDVSITMCCLNVAVP